MTNKSFPKKKKTHEAAAAKAKLESIDLEKLEADIKVAEQNLRKFRRAEDADGGVYNKKEAEPCKETTNGLPRLPSQGRNCEKSGAIAHTASAAIMSFIVAASTMCVL